MFYLGGTELSQRMIPGQWQCLSSTFDSQRTTNQPVGLLQQGHYKHTSALSVLALPHYRRRPSASSWWPTSARYRSTCARVWSLDQFSSPAIRAAISAATPAPRAASSRMM